LHAIDELVRGARKGDRFFFHCAFIPLLIFFCRGFLGSRVSGGTAKQSVHPLTFPIPFVFLSVLYFVLIYFWVQIAGTRRRSRIGQTARKTAWTNVCACPPLNPFTLRIRCSINFFLISSPLKFSATYPKIP
jgi:hypothetical protein